MIKVILPLVRKAFNEGTPLYIYEEVDGTRIIKASMATDNRPQLMVDPADYETVEEFNKDLLERNANFKEIIEQQELDDIISEEEEVESKKSYTGEELERTELDETALEELWRTKMSVTILSPMCSSDAINPNDYDTYEDFAEAVLEVSKKIDEEELICQV